MELARRTRWIALALPVALAAAAVLARPAPPGVLASGPLAGPNCGVGSGTASAIDAAWVRMDGVLDTGGTLVAQRLTVGRGTARWTETLPPESFASEPAGGHVLVGDDDGHRSRLRLLDTRSGCWSAVGVETQVVRSGVVAADGASVYEHRVERGSRRDLGVWRASLRGDRQSAPVLPGLPEDAAFGRTFATSLLLAPDGRLVVSGCGLGACRIRVVDAASGDVAHVEGTGPAVRIEPGRLVVQEACEGFPCPLDAVDLATGARTPLQEVLP